MTDFSRLGTHNMVLPPEGPKMFPNTLNFQTDNEKVLDFLLPIQQKFVSFLQAAYIDNSLNANILHIITDQVQQDLPFPAHSAGYIPLFITDSAIITFRTVIANNLTVQVIMTNVPVTPYIWSVV